MVQLPNAPRLLNSILRAVQIEAHWGGWRLRRAESITRRRQHNLSINSAWRRPMPATSTQRVARSWPSPKLGPEFSRRAADRPQRHRRWRDRADTCDPGLRTCNVPDSTPRSSALPASATRSRKTPPAASAAPPNLRPRSDSRSRCRGMCAAIPGSHQGHRLTSTTSGTSPQAPHGCIPGTNGPGQYGRETGQYRVLHWVPVPMLPSHVTVSGDLT